MNRVPVPVSTIRNDGSPTTSVSIVSTAWLSDFTPAGADESREVMAGKSGVRNAEMTWSRLASGAESGS